MTVKKSKSSKKDPKIDKYKHIRDDIIEYAGKHNFHQVITNMLYGAYMEKSDDPFTFMINFLMERNGGKVTNENGDNQKLLSEIQEKDETIKKLNKRIEYLENAINGQNSNDLQNKLSLATTVSDHSMSALENFAENPSFMQGFISNLNETTRKAEDISNTDEHPMTSDGNHDVTESIDENVPKDNDLVLTFNFSRIKSKPRETELTLENTQSTEESAESEEINEVPMDTSEENAEIYGENAETIAEVPERNENPVNHFDDFEPDYEPDDE